MLELRPWPVWDTSSRLTLAHERGHEAVSLPLSHYRCKMCFVCDFEEQNSIKGLGRRGEGKEGQLE